MEEGFLRNITKQFFYYKSLGEKTFQQLDDQQLNWRSSESVNSIGTIVSHLSGNMLSRFTDFLTSDGEKPWRKRDEEFLPSSFSRSDLIMIWEKGWKCLFDVLNDLHDDQLSQIVYIRNQGHTISEALNRQLAHYAYHVGQIVFIGKILKGDDWKSLSIPKGESASYNVEKFQMEKHRAHFTDEFISDQKASEKKD